MSPFLSQGLLPWLERIVPIGVPVEIISSGSSVITLLSFEIISSILRTMFDVIESWRTSNMVRSEEHTSELQLRLHLVCRLLLEKKKKRYILIYYLHVLN